MKKFALMCENRHEFEGWFSDAAAVRDQAEKGLIDCPFCGSLQVQKQLSAPNLSTPKTQARINKSRIGKEVAETPASNTGDMANSNSDPIALPPSASPALPAFAPALAKPGGAAVMAQQAAFRQAIQQLRKTIETEFTDVGDGFAEEARKIHYGVAEHSNIYGICTKQETEELLDEGIEILPLPDLPPEH